MITYKIESFDDTIDDLMVLIELHYDEVATDKVNKVLDIDRKSYRYLEKAGCLRIMTVRHNGVLVGYFSSIYNKHLHYQQMVSAVSDAVYVHPEYRGGTIAYRLVKEVMLDLREIGVDHISMRMKVLHPYRNLLTKLGFSLTEENWEIHL